MFKKNPDLIDQYLNLFICAIFMCVSIYVATSCTVVLGAYLITTYVDIHYDLFTIIDFTVLVLIYIIWYCSVALLSHFMRNFNRAYSSFMES